MAWGPGRPAALALPRLMLVTDRQRSRGDGSTEGLALQVAAAWRAGVQLVQVREKDLAAAAYEKLVCAIAAQAPPATWLLLNGRAALAQRLSAALAPRGVGVGVHLPASARLPWHVEGRAHWQPPVWGRAAHDVAQVAAARAEGAAYVVVGHIFATDCKLGLAPRGVEFLAQAVACAGSMPVFAIGGITVERVGEVAPTGAYGVAVSTAILAATAPAGAISHLAQAWRKTYQPPCEG